MNGKETEMYFGPSVLRKLGHIAFSFNTTCIGASHKQLLKNLVRMGIILANN